MSITRINEFRARAGRGDMVKERLGSFVPAIAASAGCQSCQLLQAEDDPTRFIVIEVWDSAEAHRAALKNVPPDAVAQIMPLLATPPTGRNFRA